MGDVTPLHDGPSSRELASELERLCFIRGEGLEALAFYRSIEDADVRGAILGLLKALAKPQDEAEVDILL